MISHSHLNRAIHCPLTYRTFCNRVPANTQNKVEELKEKLILIDKELKSHGIDASINYEVLTCVGKPENVSDATRKEIEAEQLKRIGKVFLKASAFTGFGLLCATAGAVGFMLYFFKR